METTNSDLLRTGRSSSLSCCLLFFLLLTDSLQVLGFKFVPLNREVIYEYVGQVHVGAQAPMDTERNAEPPPKSGWIVRGTLKLQRIDNSTLAAALAVEKIILHGNNQVYYQNKEMLPVYNPFKIVSNGDDVVQRVAFKRRDPPWSRNFKRAISAAIQVQGTRPGTFVEPEQSLHGLCATEYHIASRPAPAPSNHSILTVRKTSELNSCSPFAGGIHYERSNVPVNPCEFDYQKNVIVGNEATYKLEDIRDECGVFQLRHARVTGLTMVQTFESTGEAQYISSELQLSFVSEASIVNPLDVTLVMTDEELPFGGRAALLDLPLPGSGANLTMELGRDMTGGRQTEPSEKLIKDAWALFGALTDSLERSDLNFDEPYDNRVADIIQVMGQMDADALRRLYAEIDIGTSYRQETIRNLFYEIIPRIGTRASVKLTVDVIVDSRVRPWTATQLLISLPFHVLELSADLVRECEVLLELSANKPDVKESAMLSFATLVYHAYNSSRITDSEFERYVTMYVEGFSRAENYETRMIYVQGLGNMLIGKVAEYIDPIIRNDDVDTDTRFLAIIATMPLMRSRPTKVYETYWPLFNNRNQTLELRVLAFSALLLSNPTPARLMSMHNVLRDETNPHMKNFYRTTILSMSGTTHPCYQELKRLLSYMWRHIDQTDAKYWATGQYLYDYRDQRYGIGAMLQNTLIADERTSIPYIGIFEFHTEALGKFSSQLTLIIKARGLFDGITSSVNYADPQKLFPLIVSTLAKLRLPSAQSKPFHLEILVKSESKFVFSFFINANTIRDMTKNNDISRFFTILLADSHLNLQTIRWPFMLKYAVPTVLGTPAQVTIQSTMLSSLRGNLTTLNQGQFARSNHIDFRHTSYAVCKSSSYNPFLNLEHTINREQGFLVYVPVHNEFSFVVGQIFNLTLGRPANVTSAGGSLKSRSLTSTKGTILPTDKSLYNEVLISDTSKNTPMSYIRYEMRDLGLNFSAGSTVVDLTNHLAFIFQSDIKENTRVILGGNSVIDIFIMFAGILQLNAMHIGNNKNFAFLLHNDKRIKMHSSARLLEDKCVQIEVEHTAEDRTLLKWRLMVDWTNLTEVGFQLLAERYDEHHRKLQTLVDGSFQYVIFAKRPYTLLSDIRFDTPGNGSLEAPLLRSHIALAATLGMSEDSIAAWESDVGNAVCPREMLLFNPPPQVRNCLPEVFENVTMVSKYTLDVKVDEMPAWYHEYSQRLEHLVATFAGRYTPVDFSNGVSCRLDVHPSNILMRFQMDKNEFSVPNLPRYFRQLHDVRFDALPYYGLEYGVTTMCSVVGDRLNSFNDNAMLLNSTQLSANGHYLLLSECSTASHFAIMLRPLANGRFALRIQHNNDDIEYSPETAELAAVVHINGRPWPLRSSGAAERVNGTETAAAAAAPVSPVDFYVNQEGLLVLVAYVEYMVQFDMRTILTVQRINVNKERLFGLCNTPLNELKSYTVELPSSILG